MRFRNSHFKTTQLWTRLHVGHYHIHLLMLIKLVRISMKIKTEGKPDNLKL